jgi:hypothetical protein
MSAPTLTHTESAGTGGLDPLATDERLHVFTIMYFLYVYCILFEGYASLLSTQKHSMTDPWKTSP